MAMIGVILVCFALPSSKLANIEAYLVAWDSDTFRRKLSKVDKGLIRAHRGSYCLHGGPQTFCPRPSSENN